MARNRSVADLCRAVADHQRISEEGFTATASAFARQSESTAGPQTRGELSLQRTTSLDVERLVNGLVTDAHRRILREVHLQSLRDLLRAPGRRPATALSVNGPPSFPYHNRPMMRDAVWCGDETGQPILHIVAQGGIERELASFWPLRSTISMPLCVDRTVVEVSATGCRIAPDLSRDCAR